MPETDPLYRCSVNCSTNNRAWSFGFWMRQVDPISAGGDGYTVAEAMDAQLTTPLRNILSTDSVIESYDAALREPGNNPAGRFYVGTGAGLRSGAGMSNDNALYINLRQTYANAAHNGGMFIAGQSTYDQSQSSWVDAYFTSQVKDFCDAMLGNFDAVSPSAGRWTVGIFSKTVLPWTHVYGTFMDCTTCVATARVMTQSRRRQKRRGFK